MSQTTAAASNSGFFSGYFNTNGNNLPPAPLMSTMAVPPPPPTDAFPPPPPPPPPSVPSSNGDLSFPPPPVPSLPRLDMSVPPPIVPAPDTYQNWALQWAVFQQAQQLYQNQLYQSFTNQQNLTPNPVPPVNNTSNTQQYQQNHNTNTTPSKWQPSNPKPTFRPRQAQQSYRPRYPANNNNNNNNNNNQQFQSYNNVPPPSNITQSRPQQSGIRFQLNTRPQTAPNKTGRRTRFSSPPKQQISSSSSSLASYPTPMATPPETRYDDTMMDTTNSNEVRPVMNAVHAFKLACDKQNWPDSLKKYWQSIENRCTTDLSRSQADEWFQGVLVDAFQKNLVTTIDWLNKPIPEFLLRPDSSSSNVRSNNFDSTNSSLLQIAKSSYAENKQREDLLRLNKLRAVTSESVQRAFGNNDDDEDDDETTSSSRKRSSSSSSSSSSASDTDSNHRLKNMTSPQSFTSGRKRSKKPRRGKKPNKKMQFEDYQPEQCEQLEKRRNRFTNELTSTVIKPIQPPGASNIVSDNNKAVVGTCQKLEKNYLRLTSEADPLTIRPLPVLERAFSFVMNKYRLKKDWSYISDQLRSLRQDLMVQCIRNDFTVLVYEENARLALEKGDREQFNQCQTQLETLYDNGCSRTHLNEFLIYRLLYSLLLHDYKKTNRILINIDAVKRTAAAANGKSKTKDIEQFDLALDLCTAIRRKNYIRFFIIYRSLPQLASCLVNLFIDIYRKHVLKDLVWGFAPTLPIEAVTQMLAYESNETCQKHLSTLGLTLIDESLSGVSIDCKASRAIFEKK